MGEVEKTILRDREARAAWVATLFKAYEEINVDGEEDLQEDVEKRSLLKILNMVLSTFA